METKILQLDSVNLQFKKSETRQQIINNYGHLLNSLQTPIQIVCKSEQFNIDSYTINDNHLYDFIKKHTLDNNIINKTFYLILSHKNNHTLNSNLKIIKKYLTNINIHYKEYTEKDGYQWDNLLELTRRYTRDEKYYYRSMWIEDWPYSCTNGWLEFLYNSDLNIDINTYIYPQDNMKSIKYLKKSLAQYGGNVLIEEEYSNDEDKYSAEINSISTMLSELRNNQGRLFLSSYYVTVKGKTLDELNENYIYTKNLLSSKGIIANDCMFFQHMAYQNNAFTGLDKLDKKYNFTTSSLKCFFPFLANNICDKTGVYVGKNILNNDLIFLDVFARQYAVMLILGLMGSGKSFLAKNLAKNLADNGIEVTIFDKTGEYDGLQNVNNIIIHEKKTYKEYLQILKKYVKCVDDDYDKRKSKPRILLTDEIYGYINNTNEFAEEFNTLFSDIIFTGRKKFLGFGVICQMIEQLFGCEFGQHLIKSANITFLMKMKMNEAKIVGNEFELNEQQIEFLTTVEHEGILTVGANSVKFVVETTKERKKAFDTDPYHIEKEVAIDENITTKS